MKSVKIKVKLSFINYEYGSSYSVYKVFSAATAAS